MALQMPSDKGEKTDHGRSAVSARPSYIKNTWHGGFFTKSRRLHSLKGGIRFFLFSRGSAECLIDLVLSF